MKKMKTIIAGLLLGFFIQFGYAQTLKPKDVPEVVRNNFAKRYQGGIARKWEKKDERYKAYFNWHAKKSVASFDLTGVFKELQQDIEETDLQKESTVYIQKSFVDYKVIRAQKIFDVDNHIRYYVVIGKGTERIGLDFNNEGGFVKKTQLPAEKAPAPGKSPAKGKKTGKKKK